MPIGAPDGETRPPLSPRGMFSTASGAPARSPGRPPSFGSRSGRTRSSTRFARFGTMLGSTRSGTPPLAGSSGQDGVPDAASLHVDYLGRTDPAQLGGETGAGRPSVASPSSSGLSFASSRAPALNARHVAPREGSRPGRSRVAIAAAPEGSWRQWIDERRSPIRQPPPLPTDEAGLIRMKHAGRSLPRYRGQVGASAEACHGGRGDPAAWPVSLPRPSGGSAFSTPRAPPTSRACFSQTWLKPGVWLRFCGWRAEGMSRVEARGKAWGSCRIANLAPVSPETKSEKSAGPCAKTGKPSAGLL
ncbi:hypothetical protein OJF2_63260 [Aquisphaera giovannonii]|uniref:Uncharacterized protein n=1 Tax=Aquisphaera giovannonii TaxID=406548 RepID=A0A5B9WCG1_9BACT|nr:hypothetical protein OJF2_63260 [Aquisphaera giovannonii]